jgi:hypothetical protein
MISLVNSPGSSGGFSFTSSVDIIITKAGYYTPDDIPRIMTFWRESDQQMIYQFLVSSTISILKPDET